MDTIRCIGSLLDSYSESSDRWAKILESVANENGCERELGEKEKCINEAAMSEVEKKKGW